MPRRAARRNTKPGGLSPEEAARVIRERTGLPCSRQGIERAGALRKLPRACSGARPIRFIPEYLLADYWLWKGDPHKARLHEPEFPPEPASLPDQEPPPAPKPKPTPRPAPEPEPKPEPKPEEKPRKSLGRPRLPRDEHGRPIRQTPLKILEESETKIAKKLLDAVLDHKEIQRQIPQPAAAVPARATDQIIKLPQSTTEIPAGLLLSDGTINSSQAKAWAELERARKLQVERLKAEGEVISRAEIEPAWSRALVSINRSVMGIASRLKSDNGDLPLDIIQQVERLCRDALNAASAELQSLEEN